MTELELINAIQTRDLQTFKKALEAPDANVNFPYGSYGQSPLQRAASMDDYEMVEVLIRYGSEVNYQDISLQTPLHMVKSARVAELLIDAGASVTALTADGRTCLHSVKDAEAVDVLLRHGANPRLQDRYGALPIHYAISADAVHSLALAGCGIEDACQYAFTPLQMVCSKGLWQCARKMLALGASIEPLDRQGSTALEILEMVMQTLPRADVDFPSYVRTKVYLRMWQQHSSTGESNLAVKIAERVDRDISWSPLKFVCRDPSNALCNSTNLPVELLEEIVVQYIGPFNMTVPLPSSQCTTVTTTRTAAPPAILSISSIASLLYGSISVAATFSKTFFSKAMQFSFNQQSTKLVAR